MAVIHETEVYVRFCETDGAGHVNNTSYFFYLEEARTKLVSQLNLSEISNCVLVSIKCDYIAQAYASQMLNVATTIEKIGTSSFTLDQTITSIKDGEVIAKASSTMVCLDLEKKKSIPIPNSMRIDLEAMLSS